MMRISRRAWFRLVEAGCALGAVVSAVPSTARAFYAKKSKNTENSFKDGALFSITLDRDTGEPDYGSINTGRTTAVFKRGASVSPAWTCTAATIHPGKRRVTLKFTAKAPMGPGPEDADEKEIDEKFRSSGMLTITIFDGAPEDPVTVTAHESQVAPC